MDNKKPTKKQHYVPQFYLRNFLNTGKFLFAYDVEQKKFIETDATKICFENYLYETEFTGANLKLGKYVLQNNIENVFCKYEAEYAELLKRIKNICTLYQALTALILNKNEKVLLRSFIVNLLLRNPSCMRDMKISELPDDIIHSDLFYGINCLLDEMNFGGTESIFLAAQKKTMLTEEFEGSAPLKLIEHLGNLNFSFYYAKQGEFITSDMPICFGYDIYIKEKDATCLYCPLTSKVSVLFGNYEHSREMRNRMISIDGNFVDKFNWQIIKNMNYNRWIIASSKEVIQKYV